LTLEFFIKPWSQSRSFDWVSVSTTTLTNTTSLAKNRLLHFSSDLS